MSAGASVPSLARRCVAEGIGTALLLAAVVGSGIMAERLAAGDAALALLANSVATGAALVAILLAFGPVSGAHLNPLVTAASAWRREMTAADALRYVGAQAAGALAGVAIANAMFELSPFGVSARVRAGGAQLLGEFVATFGLVAVVAGVSRRHGAASVALAVGAYITAAYWFTSSTSFANPAVTLARSLTDTFSGIRPADVPGFVGAQALGAATATALFAWLESGERRA